MRYPILANLNIQNERFRLFYNESYTVPLKTGLALRVYSDSRPRNLKIAALQKGLVLVLNGTELIEEGAGFGVPVAIYSDMTFFSSSAQIFVEKGDRDKIIVKRFFMDTVSRRNWKIGPVINNPLFKSISAFLEEVYRKYPDSRKVIFPLIKFTKKAGVRTEFIKSKPRGEVFVTYNVKQDHVYVETNLTRLKKAGLKRLVLLNEQGSTFFRRFLDSNGSNLVDEEIGAWEPVKATQACFSDLNYSLNFCLRNLPKYRLFMGREFIKGLLAWAGMEYELEPYQDHFAYTIQICLKKDEN